jgi:hypothetical protein
MFTKTAMDTSKMFSYLDIFALDTFLGTNNEPPQHYRLPNHTWNAYQLALDFDYIIPATCNQHTLNTQLLDTSIKIWKLSKVVSDWCQDCLNVMNDRNHLWELKNSFYHWVGLESLNLETMHFWTYVDINYFYYLHARNSFLKLCCVFLERLIYCHNLAVVWLINRRGSDWLPDLFASLITPTIYIHLQ